MNEQKIETMDLEKARQIVGGLTDEQIQAFQKVLTEDPEHLMETIQVLAYAIAKMAIPANSHITTLKQELTVDGEKWVATTKVVVNKKKANLKTNKKNSND